MEEPWLRGPIPSVDPLIAPVLYAFTQAREDLAQFTEGLTTEQIWKRGVGFHIRHIARSIDRLLSYAEGKQLDESQIAAMKTELDGNATRDELFAELAAGLERAAMRSLHGRERWN